MLRGTSTARAHTGPAQDGTHDSPPRRSARLRPVEHAAAKGTRAKTHESSSDSFSTDVRVGSAFDARPGRRAVRSAGKVPRRGRVFETLSSDDDFFGARRDFDVDGDDEICTHMDACRARLEPDVMPLHPAMLYCPSHNADIAPAMRCKLVNWLLEVCLHFRLHRATLYLAVHYVDRYLSVVSHTRRAGFQLLGVTSLFTAAKLEEIYPPKLSAFAELCDGACPPRDIVAMELCLLDALEWRLGAPTSLYWLGLYVGRLRRALPPSSAPMHHAQPSGVHGKGHFAPDIDADEVSRGATALLDLALHTTGNTAHAYSVLAASALHLQLHDERAVHALTGYAHTSIRECVAWMWALCACPVAAVCDIRDAEAVLGDTGSEGSPTQVFDAAVAVNARVMEYVAHEMRWGRL